MDIVKKVVIDAAITIFTYYIEKHDEKQPLNLDININLIEIYQISFKFKIRIKTDTNVPVFLVFIDY